MFYFVASAFRVTQPSATYFSNQHSATNFSLQNYHALFLLPSVAPWCMTILDKFKSWHLWRRHHWQRGTLDSPYNILQCMNLQHFAIVLRTKDWNQPVLFWWPWGHWRFTSGPGFSTGIFFSGFTKKICLDINQSCKNVPTVPTSRCYFFWPVLIFGKSMRKTGENPPNCILARWSSLGPPPGGRHRT